MPRFLYALLFIVLFTACGKDNSSLRVDFYLLSSYNVVIDTSTNPYILTIANPVLSDDPFIANHNIVSYSQSKRTFTLTTEVGEFFKNHNPANAFAVTVNKQPVYYGLYHPLYLSSLVFGLPTVDPVFTRGRELPVNYVTLTGSPDLLQLDKRNDRRLLQALRASGRLR